MGKKVIRLSESDLERIVNRVISEQTPTAMLRAVDKVSGHLRDKKNKTVEVINGCRSKFQMQPPESCLAVFAKIDKGQTPSYEEIKKCAADIVLQEGKDGLGFITCILKAF